MSSHPATAPLCEACHSLMVPIDTTFGYIPNNDGVITALIIYFPTDEGIDSHTYALLPDGMPAELPHPSDEAIGERIQLLRDSRKLVDLSATISEWDGLFRIDDARPDKGHSYLVWFPAADGILPFPGLLPGRIYGFYRNGVRDAGQVADFPAQMTRAELDDLMAAEGVRPITPEDVRPGAVRGERLPKISGLRVWDLTAMYRADW